MKIDELIEALEAKCETLRSRVAELEGRLSDMADDRDELRVCVQELKAERDRLREFVLWYISTEYDSLVGISRALAALTPKEEKP